MNKNKISAVYKIVNTVTGDSYVGSSRNVKKIWEAHKCPSRWKQHLNSPMYQDMQKYGIDKFRFQILAPVEPEYLKQVEQEFIEMLNPTYNDRRSKCLDVERLKEVNRKWRQSDKGKEYHRNYMKYGKGKSAAIKSAKKYFDQLCLYNGETLRFISLIMRFKRARIEHPAIEARKYLIEN